MAGPGKMKSWAVLNDMFTDTLESVYNSSKYSDLTIYVGGKSFKLHKLVVCGQSEKLSDLCEGQIEITLNPVKDLEYPQAYEVMFRYMYGLKYDEKRPVGSKTGFYFAVCLVARTYGCPVLDQLAFEELEKETMYNWGKDEFLKILGNDGCQDDPGFFGFLVATCLEHIDQLSTDHRFQSILEKRQR